MALNVDNDNLEEILNKKTITLLQFSAEWCGPCKMLSPIIIKLSEENIDKDITIAKVNVDTNAELGKQFGIRSIPTIVYLKNGVEIERSSGFSPKDVLQLKIDSLLN